VQLFLELLQARPVCNTIVYKLDTVDTPKNKQRRNKTLTLGFCLTSQSLQSYSKLGYSRFGRSPKVTSWQLLWHKFYRSDDLPITKPTNSVKALKHDKEKMKANTKLKKNYVTYGRKNFGAVVDGTNEVIICWLFVCQVQIFHRVVKSRKSLTSSNAIQRSESRNTAAINHKCNPTSSACNEKLLIN